jgi:hypothetical protein
MVIVRQCFAASLLLLQLVFGLSLLDYRGVVIVFWPLLVKGQSFASGDVAVEVVTCRTYCDPVVINRVSCRPPEFNQQQRSQSKITG